MFEAIDPVSWSWVRRPCQNGREEVRTRGGAASEAAVAAAITHLRSRPVRLLCQQAVHARKELDAWRRVAYPLGRIEDALHELVLGGWYWASRSADSICNRSTASDASSSALASSSS